MIKYLESLVFQFGGVIFTTQTVKLIQQALGVCVDFLSHSLKLILQLGQLTDTSRRVSIALWRHNRKGLFIFFLAIPRLNNNLRRLRGESVLRESATCTHSLRAAFSSSSCARAAASLEWRRHQSLEVARA